MIITFKSHRRSLGQSTLAIHVAQMIALRGQQTLLIDTHDSNFSEINYFLCKSGSITNGIDNYVNELAIKNIKSKNDFLRCVHETKEKNLFIMAASSITQLDQTVIGNLLSDANKYFDHVIVDLNYRKDFSNDFLSGSDYVFHIFSQSKKELKHFDYNFADKLVPILNRFDENIHFSSKDLMDDFKSHKFNCKEIFVIPFSQDVLNDSNDHAILYTLNKNTDSNYVSALNNLVDFLLGDKAVVVQNKGWLNKWKIK